MKRPRENGEIKKMADPDLAILGQYALAKITRRSERAPHLMHFPSSRSAFIGMLRMVALVSSLTRSSHSPEPARPLEQRLLDGLDRIQNSLGETLLGSRAFLAVIPPRQNDLIFLQILGSHLDAERHSAFFPVVEFPPGTVLLARIDFEADSRGLEG